MKEYLNKQFEGKYGNKEVELPRPLCVIRDNCASPFSSGSNGYIKKLRVKDGKLQYYLDFWNYGWYNADDGKYTNEIECALKQVI